MQFLITTSDNGDINWSSKEQLLKSEARHIWSLYKQSIIKNIWFTEKKDAVLIVEAENLEIAISVINSLPLVKEELLKYTVNNLLPYTGFDRIMYGTD